MMCGCQILWNAIAICESSKTPWQTEKLRMNEDLENLSKDQLSHLVHWLNTSQIPRDTKLKFINSERKYYQESFQDMLRWREGFGKETFWLLMLKDLEKLDASEIYSWKLNAKEVLITHKDGEFVFPVADGSAT